MMQTEFSSQCRSEGEAESANRRRWRFPALWVLLAGAVVCWIGGSATTAQALLITPLTTPAWRFDGASNIGVSEFENYLNSWDGSQYTNLSSRSYASNNSFFYDLGGDTLASVYDASMSPDAEVGPFAPNYSTDWPPHPGDTTINDAFVNWDGGASMGYEHLFLMVKDGNSTPNIYFFDLNALGWDGMEQLHLDSFFPDKDSFSHIEFLAGGDQTSLNPIPEPASLAVWSALGLAGLVVHRRHRRRASSR